MRFTMLEIREVAPEEKTEEAVDNALAYVVTLYIWSRVWSGEL